MAFGSPYVGALPNSFLPTRFSPQISSLPRQAQPQPQPKPQPRRLRGVVRSALREWKEYEEAVKRKDLAGALRFLKSVEHELRLEPSNGSSQFGHELGLSGFQRDWEVLDTCLNADDMRLVGNAFKFLKDRGFLPNFGKFRNIGNPFFTFFCKYLLVCLISESFLYCC